LRLSDQPEQEKEKKAGKYDLPDETESRSGKKNQDRTGTEDDESQNQPGAFF
jgi:hypothetical protein